MKGLNDDHVRKALKQRGAYIANVEGEGYVLMPGGMPKALEDHLHSHEGTRDYFEATLLREKSPLHGAIAMLGDDKKIDEFRQRYSTPDRPIPLLNDGQEVSLEVLRLHELDQGRGGMGARGAGGGGH